MMSIFCAVDDATFIRFFLYRGPGFLGHKVGFMTEIQGD